MTPAELPEEIVPIVVVSKGRYGNVSTLDLLPKGTAKLVVPKFEQAKYHEAHPDVEVLATPATVKGIVATRQWVIEQFESVFMLDDDVYAVCRMFEDISTKVKITDPLTVYEIIQSSAAVARDLGAKVFGFSSYRDPVNYLSQNPIRMSAYLNASFCGFLKDHNLYYNLDIPEAEDYWISLLCVFKHRYLYQDTRYSFFTKANFVGEGGMASDRTQDKMIESTVQLKKYFGDVVNLKRPSNSKKSVNVGERSIAWPF
jgi:hypothetical protein